jgi:hypothetical protein
MLRHQSRAPLWFVARAHCNRARAPGLRGQQPWALQCGNPDPRKRFAGIRSVNYEKGQSSDVQIPAVAIHSRSSGDRPALASCQLVEPGRRNMARWQEVLGVLRAVGPYASQGVKVICNLRGKAVMSPRHQSKTVCSTDVHILTLRPLDSSCLQTCVFTRVKVRSG